MSLLEELNEGSSSNLSEIKCDDFIQYGLLPMMISLQDLSTLPSNCDQISHENAKLSITSPSVDQIFFPPAGDQRHTRSLEDIIRYGGDMCMSSLNLYENHIHEAFYFLCEASSHAVLQSEGQEVTATQEGKVDHSTRTRKSHGNGDEALLSAVCKYLSCCGLLLPSRVAKVAKRSLHARLRPRPLLVPLSGNVPNGTKENNSPFSDASAPDVVTVSLTEFEEMFIRCAFSIWELSGALDSSRTEAEPDPATLLQYHNSNLNKIVSSVKDTVYKYCIEGMQVSTPPTGSSSEQPAKDMKDARLSWGVDFIGPFTRTLLAMSPLPDVTKENDDKLALEKKIELAKQIAHVKQRLEVEEKILKAKRDALLVGRSYVDSYMLPRDPTTPLLFDEAVPELPPLQQLLDKTEYLNQQSGGIHVLLDGTKEELWPVYATYCSCGDSVDPGKLTGPNLFTLLSKLGILNNRTVISDVGILLHQISSHLHAQSTSSLASLSSTENIESPSLSFEQFLVFLCSYSQLFFDSSNTSAAEVSSISNKSQNTSVNTVNKTIPLNSAPLSQQPSPSPSIMKREAIKLIYAEANLNGITEECILKDSIRTNSQSITDPSMIDTHNEIKRKNLYLKNRLGGSAGLSIIINQTNIGNPASASRAWFSQWLEYMNSSSTFRRLLENHMLPVLRGHTLLAFPDDARLRDRYAVLFSLEVLLTLQRVEGLLRSVFCTEGGCGRNEGEHVEKRGDRGGGRGSSSSPAVPLGPQMMPIVTALNRINLVPQVISEAHIMQLLKDVMPERVGVRINGMKSACEDLLPMKDEGQGEEAFKQVLLFPHWEWIICVVAYEAMYVIVRTSNTKTDPEIIPSLVAKLIASIASAMDLSFK